MKVKWKIQTMHLQGGGFITVFSTLQIRKFELDDWQTKQNGKDIKVIINVSQWREAIDNDYTSLIYMEFLPFSLFPYHVAILIFICIFMVYVFAIHLINFYLDWMAFSN